MIRVVIADDSRVARDVLRSILERADDIEIVGEAVDGRDAVDKVRELAPHVVTMDLNMPRMDGIAAIEEIMYSRARPILVVSDRSDAESAYRALEVGALDVITKPELEGEAADAFLYKVRLLAGVSVITRLRRYCWPPASRPTDTGLPAAPEQSASSPSPFSCIFAIACSTGGPQALARLLSQLNTPFPAPILIAQHISHGFIDGMAQWLATRCRLPVRVARHNEALQAGCVYLAPSEYNLSVTLHHRLQLSPSPPGTIYHPSGDVLLASVAEVYTHHAIGIIMTGMGRDGVLGMSAIHRRGGVTLAQDEASSVIYGMNQEAVNAGVIQQILPLDELAAAMDRQALRRKPAGMAPGSRS
ncbi:chemotaxis-specific protein-glutamate methyltransferase CheB [Vreelandella rituensis]|uniref:Protein-glutamate methylesterase/protein-glutamine glutaminase n=1 Tax=Vreelandella rituensis TaxID=2282306 RepID=A0A368TXZ4_9GAMM|nr:chemotaxis-specific protein-glutamate methyltransferase CheB [Halomonas rituensis]RCV89620.1 chemotaxis-specific protein-glutamate methyltransferase CheB [Halomonas rituensis]